MLQNLYHTKDVYCKSTKELRENKDIIILSGDKDKSVTTMKKVDYEMKIANMINEAIVNGKYKTTEDTTIRDLSSFQSFLYRHFKDHEEYKDLKVISRVTFSQQRKHISLEILRIST